MEDSVRYPCGLNVQDVVGVGITGIVARLDALIKFVDSSKRLKLEMIKRERRVYQRLGSEYQGVLRYFGTLDDALILQYAANGSIRQYFAGQASPVQSLFLYEFARSTRLQPQSLSSILKM